MVLWGTMFLAFAVPLSVFFWVVRKSPKLVIVMTTSSFVWLLAALATSIVWVAVPPLKGELWWAVLWGVLFQEVGRWLMWRLLKKAESGLNSLAADGEVKITREKQALTAGLGYGLMSTVMQFTSVLDSATGPGTLPARGCKSMSLFVISAIITSMLCALHILWSVIFNRAMEEKTLRGTHLGLADWKIFFVVLSHAGFSFLTLNNEAEGSCAATMIPQAALLILTAIFTWGMLGMKINRNKAD